MAPNGTQTTETNGVDLDSSPWLDPRTRLDGRLDTGWTDWTAMVRKGSTVRVRKGARTIAQVGGLARALLLGPASAERGTQWHPQAHEGPLEAPPTAAGYELRSWPMSGARRLLGLLRELPGALRNYLGLVPDEELDAAAGRHPAGAWSEVASTPDVASYRSPVDVCTAGVGGQAEGAALERPLMPTRQETSPLRPDATAEAVEAMLKRAEGRP